MCPTYPTTNATSIVCDLHVTRLGPVVCVCVYLRKYLVGRQWVGRPICVCAALAHRPLRRVHTHTGILGSENSTVWLTTVPGHPWQNAHDGVKPGALFSTEHCVRNVMCTRSPARDPTVPGWFRSFAPRLMPCVDA